jgi:hypothetical protein
MPRQGPTDGDKLNTVTHARLRAGQGDHAQACRILKQILKRHPGHLEATKLLKEYSGSGREPGTRPRASQRESSIRRLEKLLRKIESSSK